MMSTFQSRINVEYCNWLKVGLALNYLKEGLKEFVDSECKAFHQSIIGGIPAAKNACTVCETRDIKPDRKTKKYKIGCPSNICDAILEEIVSNHLTGKNIPWFNSDVTKWTSDYWSVAKLYLTQGQPGKTGVADCDCTNILNLVINCMWFYKNNQKINTLLADEIWRHRNELMYSRDMRLSSILMADWLTDMVKLLESLVDFQNRKQAVAAASLIKQIRDAGTSIKITASDEIKVMHEHLCDFEEKMNDTDKALEKVKDECQQISLNLQQVSGDKQKDLDKHAKEIQDFSQMLTENCKQVQRDIQNMNKIINQNPDLAKTMNTQFSGFNTHLTSLSENLDETRSGLERCTSLYPSLSCKVQQLEGAVSNIEQLMDSVEQTSGQVGQLKSAVEGMEQRMDTKTAGQVGQLKIKVEGMEQRMDNKIEELQTAVGGVSQRMNTVEQRIDTSETISDRSTLEMLLQTDDRYRQLYVKELETGEVKMHNLRLMVVGNVETGKTTLSRRLLDQDVDINKRDKTNGIDLHVHRVKIDLVTKEWIILAESGQEEHIMSKLKMLMPDSSKVGTKDSVDLRENEVVSDGHMNTSVATDDQTHAEVIYDRKNHTGNFDGRPILKRADASKDVQLSNCMVKGNKKLKLDKSVPRTSETTSKEKEFSKLCDQLMEYEASESEKYAFASIWDFAGDKIYYSSHQTFMSPDAVYILTHRLDADCQVHPDAAEIFQRWMHSIHWYSGCNENGSPPVILVGTFKDRLADDNAEEGATRRALKKRLALDDDPACDHLKDEFMISNKTVEMKELRRLKQCILDLAENHLKNWGKPIPATWLLLLRKLKSQKKRILKMEEVIALNEGMVPKVSSKDGLLLFLIYQHEVGELMFYDEEGLRHMVVVDPQLYIDALKSIFCSEEFFLKKSRTGRRPWVDLISKGELSEELIDSAFEETEDLKDNKDILLAYMTRSHVIAEFTQTSADQKSHCVERLFLAPCMLEETVPIDIKDDVKHAKKITSTLCFVSEKRVLPAAVFHRLTAACLKNPAWILAQKLNRKVIFSDFVEFMLNKTTFLQLFHKQHTIQMRILYFAKQDFDLPIMVFGQIESYLLEISRLLNVVRDGKDNLFQVCLKCEKASLDVVDNLTACSKAELLSNEMMCPYCKDQHILESANVIGDWFNPESKPAMEGAIDLKHNELRSPGLFRAPYDASDTIANYAVLVECANSVGVICYTGGRGTGFRCGPNYIMTAAHILADIKNTTPLSSGTQTAALADTSVWIDFSFHHQFHSSSHQTCFHFKPVICYENPTLDVAVLELEVNPHSLPPPPPFCHFADIPGNCCIRFIGHDLGDVKKTDKVPQIHSLAPGDRQTAAQFSISRVGRDGYQGIDDPDRVLFHCTFRQGASGSPGIVIKQDGTVSVVTMLLKGYPSWFYDPSVSHHVTSAISHNDLIEQGVRMSSVKADIERNNPMLHSSIFC